MVDITSHLLTFEGRPAVLVISEDVTEREQSARAIAERNQMTSLTADIGLALNRDHPLSRALQMCTDTLAQHLPETTVRIWRAEPGGKCFAAQACAGSEGPRVGSPTETLPFVIRHPLTVQARMYGMLTVSARRVPSDAMCVGLASIAGHIALAIARYEAEDARRLLADIVEDSEDAILSKSLDGQILSWNAGAEKLYGFTAAEVIGQSVMMIVPESRRDEMPQLLEELAHGRHLNHYETVRQRKDGSVVNVSLTLSPIRDGAGSITGASAIARDITERQRAVAALREAEERMRFALTASQVGVWEANMQTGTSYWSETCEALHGLQPGTFGRTFEAFVGRIHPDDRAQATKAMQEALRCRHEFELEYRTIWPSGDERWIRSTARFFYDTDGTPLRGAGISIDITEQRRLEDQLRQAQKMEAVGRLAGGVAHDFNNLLTAILGYGELLADEFSANPRAMSDLGEIRKAAESAASLTRQMLAFSRKQVLQPQTLDLNDVVVRAESLLRRTIGEDVTLVPRLDASLGLISADPGQLEQIIMNLAVNARDAMPQGGELIIETTNVDVTDSAIAKHRGLSCGPHVMLAVSDTGIGMDATVRSQIFEPFFTTKPDGKGTGLGLATVYGIVRQSGGAIWVYSEPGRGTSFKIYFPQVFRAAASPIATASHAPSSGTETILVVEDQVAVRAIVRKALVSRGYTVLEASEGPEALELMARHEGTIDLLLTDVVMPTMSGRQLADRMQGRHAQTRVLFMSGYTDEAVLRSGIVGTNVAFLQKPFSPDTVRNKVREVLDAALIPN